MASFLGIAVVREASNYLSGPGLGAYGNLAIAILILAFLTLLPFNLNSIRQLAERHTTLLARYFNSLLVMLILVVWQSNLPMLFEADIIGLSALPIIILFILLPSWAAGNWGVLLCCWGGLLGVACYLDAWRGMDPVLLPGSDAQSILAFALARARPANFVQDALLSNLDNFGFYQLVAAWVIQLAALLGMDLGQVLAAFSIPTLVAVLGGFYYLGLQMFRDKVWATTLALVNIVPSNLMVEHWGIANGYLPREAYIGIWALLIALCFYWRQKPEKWWLIMALCGGSVFFHPIGGPTQAVAVWFGLWSFWPKNWRFIDMFRHMVVAGLAFAALLMPYATLYLLHHEFGSVSQSDEIIKVLFVRFSQHNFSIAASLTAFFSAWPTAVYWWGASLVALAYLLARIDTRRQALFLILLEVGTLVTCALIPAVDLWLTLDENKLPLEWSLIRGLRFLFPVMLLSLLLGAWRLVQEPIFSPLPQATNVGRLGALFLLILWPHAALSTPIPRPALETFLCWANQSRYCAMTPEQASMTEMMHAVQEFVPAEEAVLAQRTGLHIRYAARRSISFSPKDGAVLLYNNPIEALRWFDMFDQYLAADRVLTSQERLVALAALARQWGAHYLLLDSWALIEPGHPGQEIFRNGTGVLYRLP